MKVVKLKSLIILFIATLFISILDLSNSLIIVTADHASAMSYSGFATPKNLSVLGMDRYVSNVDGKPYQLLTYSSGLGYQNYNETAAIHDFRNSYHKATIPSTWSNHAADDVPIYAIGSMANLLFSGTFDQTYLAHAVAYAMCIFEYESRCHSSSHIHRVKPVHERKIKGIEALKQELNKNAQNKPIGTGNSLEKLRSELDVTSTEKNLEDKVIDEFLSNNTFIEELYESSDLVSNFTENNNSSSMMNLCNLKVFAVVLLIKFSFY